MDILEVKKVADELKKGREIARKLQLQLQLYQNMPSSSTQTLQVLVQKIFSSFENAISLLNFNSSTRDIVIYPSGVIPRMSESPAALREDANREDHRKDISRKRKSIARSKEQVRVSPGTGLEGPLDDGFCWRKYGQKQIHGFKYPRGYYRCIQRDVEGCLATKQVQRSDEDPTIFDITYYANHTCTQQSPENQESTDFLASKLPQEFHFDSSFRSLNQSSFEFPSTSDITMADQSQQVFSVNDLAMADAFMGNLSQSGSDFQNCDQPNISAVVATDPPGFGFEFEFNPDFIFDHSGFLCNSILRGK